MEFSQKLQELRKQKGLTQEELAAALYVSRTAVSKWESGRGYPNIDSLKAIATFFTLTVDDLLSSDELLCVAQEESRQTAHHACDLVFGLLDVCAALFLFLPLFAQRADTMIKSVSLLSLTAASPYLRAVYFAAVGFAVVWGVLTLALQNVNRAVWLTCKRPVSLAIGVGSGLVFILGLQPYAAVLSFAFLVVKALLLTKKV